MDRVHGVGADAPWIALILPISKFDTPKGAVATMIVALNLLVDPYL
jgi:hypothetical protein